jgi:shikimate kinase
LSVWLQADVEVLARRVARKNDRPLLHGRDPRQVLAALAAERYPIYAEADLAVESAEAPHHVTVQAIIDAIAARRHAQTAAT